MNQQLKKGIIEFYVLAFLKRNDSYGYKIVQYLAPFFDISESTLYPILRRLCKYGDLETYSLKQNGRLRNYYKITKKGEDRLIEFDNDLKVITQVYDELMERAYKS